jgi:hypothetical protein
LTSFGAVSQKTGGRDVNNKVVVTDNPFQETMNALNERGEKLLLLYNKTNAMADSAKMFHDISQSARK